MAKITDKQRLDWMTTFRALIKQHGHRSVGVQGCTAGHSGYGRTLREAIDDAMSDDEDDECE